MVPVEPFGNAGALLPYVHPDHKPAPVPQFIRDQVKRLRDVVPRTPAQQRDSAWSAIPEATRTLLLAECTERNLNSARLLRWRDLTDSERSAIGARVRGLVRDLGPVAGALLP